MNIIKHLSSDLSKLATNYYESFIDYLPNLIATTIVIGAGYFLSGIIGHLVRKLFYSINLDKMLRKADLDDSFGKISLARLFGTLAKWFVFFIFFTIGIRELNISILNSIYEQIAGWILAINISIIIVILGFICIDFILYKVWEIRTKFDSLIQFLSKATFVFVVVLAVLQNRGIDISVVLYPVIAVVALFVLPFSIALGIGGGIWLSKNMDNLKVFFNKK